MEFNIGERIIKLRKEKGLTQSQLAEKLNISNKAVSKWESGKGDPSIEMLFLLSDCFNCSIDYLIRGKDYIIVKTVKNNSKEEVSYAQEVFDKALSIVKTKVSAISFDVWLSSIKVAGLEQGFLPNEFCLQLYVPTIAVKNMIVKNYEKLILDAIMEIDDSICYLTYRLENIFNDPFFKPALRLAINNKGVSVAFLQRRLSIGYSRAAQLVDAMEEMNFVSSSIGKKLRDVYINEKKYEEIFNEKYD